MANAFTLPSGKTQFLDGNGNPLASGLVYHYIPSTSTPKDTYKDVDASTLNTNPVVLNSAGEAVIFGIGAYRQVVTDSLGNQQWDQVTQVASLTTLGAVAVAGDTMTGTLVTPGISDTAGQTISITPTGDAVTTLTSLNIQGTTTSTITREFLAAFGFVSNKRNGAGGTVTPTVTLYSGIQGQSGTSDIWAVRAVAIQDASSGTYNALPVEIDLTNNVGDRGNTAGSGGLSAPVSYGLTITGAGSNKSTAAQIITGPGSAIWNRGIVVTQNSVAQVSFQDFGNSTTSIEIDGSHTYGVDTKAASFSGAGIRLGFTHNIKSRDAGDTTDYNVISYNGTILLGSPGIIIDANGNIFPHSDNTYAIGQNANRFTAVWAVNGTIQTSDPSLKTDITALSTYPATTIDALLDAISPIHFKWIDGGMVDQVSSEMQSVQATETKTTEIETVEIRDGVPVLVKSTKTENVPVFDDIPVVDETGAPVMVTIPEKPASTGEDGVITPAQPERIIPMMHRVPRMENKMVQVTTQVSRPGNRVHWGWNAAEVKAAFDSIGVDFGGYVKADDGSQHLRPDQLIPVLWQAVKALTARVAVLEAK